MYFWKIKALKKLITEQGLTEAQVFYYVLLYVGLGAVGMEIVAYFPPDEPNGWDYIQSVLNVVIPITGTIFAYKANGGPSGRTFAAKYFSISFVMVIRFLVYLVPVMVILFAYYWPSFESEETIQTGWFEVVLVSTWYAGLYLSIAKHIHDTVRA